ncbi:MAG: hypothetical protein WDZ96_03705 [Acidimicrobiia bacterium]
MIRLVLGALLAAVAAAFILIQMQGAVELALWEALLVLLVALQYRGIPNRGDPLEVPLFSIPPPDLSRLPRAIASSELMVVDATSGYLSPDRRLRPGLRRIAEHRLDLHGVRLDSSEAVGLLGEKDWNTLMRSGDEAVQAEELESLVTGLEKL